MNEPDSEPDRPHVVLASCRVVPQCCSAPLVPGDKALAISVGQHTGTQQRAVILVHQEGAVCPFPHELDVEPALVDHDPGDRQRDCCVCARAHPEPAVGLHRKADMPRIDDDELGAAATRFGYSGCRCKQGRARIMAP